ncbi:hypothetical protein RGQ29_002998 [Quercus rubra]|uniref:Uncharacterized protein n=1 Tax=Quercus rubra TaxID=3512 RepID=A0AAN7EBL0_QUERU|nr:hypothetical protein RGQ29_002998 [Quercus rubra]
MKTLSVFFLFSLVLFVFIGNEQMVVEAKTCKIKIEPERPGLDCLSAICDSACKRKYEPQEAKGICLYDRYCYCYYPC